MLPLVIDGLPEQDRVNIVNAGFRMSSDGPGVSEAPPRLGEHGRELLEWLGYSRAEIEGLLDTKDAQ
jgi:crotonobetainyl-CoA:carnitine CoA-transferase CaiB-like acyl-CoA transferase